MSLERRVYHLEEQVRVLTGVLSHVLHRWTTKCYPQREASCFYCLRVWNIEECPIKERIDGGGTPLCPHCGIDSVLPFDPGKELLNRMHETWFRRTFKMKR